MPRNDGSPPPIGKLDFPPDGALERVPQQDTLTEKPTPPAEPSTAHAIARLEASVVRQVEQDCAALVAGGSLQVPTDYSVANAMRSAGLKLLSVTDRNRRPALEVCTPASVVEALFSMVVQGLDPGRDQCHFIVHGNQLACRRSSMGALSVARRAEPALEISTIAVFEGDTITFRTERGVRFVDTHESNPEAVAAGKVVAAYAWASYTDDSRPDRCEYMDIGQIRAAWRQGQGYRGDSPTKPGVHQKFSDEMARKTVRSRICKQIIGESTDKHLAAASRFGQLSAVTVEAGVEAGLKANAGPVLGRPQASAGDPEGIKLGRLALGTATTTQEAAQDPECPF